MIGSKYPARVLIYRQNTQRAGQICADEGINDLLDNELPGDLWAVHFQSSDEALGYCLGWLRDTRTDANTAHFKRVARNILNRLHLKEKIPPLIIIETSGGLIDFVWLNLANMEDIDGVKTMRLTGQDVDIIDEDDYKKGAEFYRKERPDTTGMIKLY